MLTNLFSNTNTSLSINMLCISSITALVLGFIIALTHKYTSRYTKEYLITLGMIPFLVQLVILLVNGNLGAGIATAGAFSLIRFRSLPGNAKEIITVFFAMVVGLTIGSGYAFLAVLTGLLGCIILVIYDKIKLFDKNPKEKYLTITIPEDVDYQKELNDIFDNYTKKKELLKVKTIDMGSMFQLKYLIELKKDHQEKEFIDELRVRNGNLKIILSSIGDDNDL